MLSTKEIHIDAYVFFLHECDCLKIINHFRKILELSHLTIAWFIYAIISKEIPTFKFDKGIS